MNSHTKIISNEILDLKKIISKHLKEIQQNIQRNIQRNIQLNPPTFCFHSLFKQVFSKIKFHILCFFLALVPKQTDSLSGKNYLLFQVVYGNFYMINALKM